MTEFSCKTKIISGEGSVAALAELGTDAAVEQFNSYICNQVLADELKISDNVEGDNVVELDNAVVKLSVRKL